MRKGKTDPAAAATARPLSSRILDNWQLYLMLLIPLALTIIYKYVPMIGIQIAFRDYKASRGIFGSPWVGLKWFKRFFGSPNCLRMIKNTFLLSLYSLLWSFPVPIIMSLALNQLRFKWETMSDSISEQVNVRIAGDQLPDAFQGIGFTNYDLTNYGEDGTFIDLRPYLTEEYMPNLTKILEEHPDVRAAITMSDGGIYGLPSGEQMGTAGIGAEEDYSIFTIPQFSMINKAWLDDLGLEVPTTLDELKTALQAFKDNDMSAKYYGNEAGPKLILSEYYSNTFKMEERAIERLTDLYEYWMPYVDDMTTYPVDCVFTKDELDTIDMYKTDFENTVAEYEGKWLKDGGPSDEEWEAYKSALTDNCGLEELKEVYQAAYDRYAEAAAE